MISFMFLRTVINYRESDHPCSTLFSSLENKIEEGVTSSSGYRVPIHSDKLCMFTISLQFLMLAPDFLILLLCYYFQGFEQWLPRWPK